MSTSQNQRATAALETLHGARGLPPAEGTAKLRDFADSIGTALTPTARLADASGALRTLVDQLQSQGTATDDTWEYAIETMLSYANVSVLSWAPDHPDPRSSLHSQTFIAAPTLLPK